MIPAVILIGLACGGVTPRLLPAPVTAAALLIVAVLWGVLVGEPWGVVLAGANVTAGVVVGFLMANLGTKLLPRR